MPTVCAPGPATSTMPLLNRNGSQQPAVTSECLRKPPCLRDRPAGAETKEERVWGGVEAAVPANKETCSKESIILIL